MSEDTIAYQQIEDNLVMLHGDEADWLATCCEHCGGDIPLGRKTQCGRERCRLAAHRAAQRRYQRSAKGIRARTAWRLKTNNLFRGRR